MVGGCRRDATTTVSNEVMSWKWDLSCSDTTQLLFMSLPMGQHKNPEADVTHLSPSLLLLAGLQRLFLTVCSPGQMQVCQVYSLLLDPWGVHPFLTA